MSRPKPEIVLSGVDPKTNKDKQVVATDYIYIVLYDGKLIGLRDFTETNTIRPFSYKRTSFPQQASANNLAKRLNKFYNTTKFTVIAVDGTNAIPGILL